MEGLHYPRPCGCKGIRSCLVCEGKNYTNDQGIAIEDKSVTKYKGKIQNLWQFCHVCGKVQPPKSSTQEEFSGSASGHGNKAVCPIQHDNQGFFVAGIQVIPDFITAEEEVEMVCVIEQSPWKPSQSGRYKQDYGPKPNFKRKKVKPGGFTGLPSFSKPFVSRMTQLDSLKDFIPVEQCHLEYTPDRGSAIDLHFDDFWLWGNRLVTMNLLSDTYLLLKLDQPEHSGDGIGIEVDVTHESKSAGVNRIKESMSNATKVLTESKLNGEAHESQHQNRRDGFSQAFSECSGTGAVTEPSLNGRVQGHKSASIERQAEDSQTVKDLLIPMPRRSLLVLSNDARYKWKHAIPRELITSRRIAVTLRELASEFLPGGSQEAEGQKLLDIALTYKGSVVP